MKVVGLELGLQHLEKAGPFAAVGGSGGFLRERTEQAELGSQVLIPLLTKLSINQGTLQNTEEIRLWGTSPSQPQRNGLQPLNAHQNPSASPL